MDVPKITQKAASLISPFGLDREHFELPSLTPSAMSQATREGALDAGPVPLVACFEQEEHLVPLGDLCIATTEEAQSILLFSQRPLEKMGGGIFGITEETTTSVQLLKVLLQHRYHVRPKALVGLEEDKALQERYQL